MPGVFKLVWALFVRAGNFWRWLIPANIQQFRSFFSQIFKKMIPKLMLAKCPPQPSKPVTPSYSFYPQELLCPSNEPTLRPPPIPTASSITVSDYDEALPYVRRADLAGIPIYSTSAEIVNDISRRTFSLQPEGRRVVVTPSSSTLHLDHNVAAIGSASLNASDDIAGDIYPCMPPDLPRYARNRIINPSTPSCTIKPLLQDFGRGQLPDGWSEQIHPEGQPFFYHESKKIITDAWIWDIERFQTLDDYIQQIEGFILSRDLCRPLDTDLVLELQTTVEGQSFCFYYFVSHSTRTLFWLEEFAIDNYLGQVKGDLSLPHIKRFLEQQYWTHWDLFPIQRLTDSTLDHVADAIASAQIDVLTSGDSTVNHDFTELKNMQSMVTNARSRIGLDRECSSWFAGRIMKSIWEDRFRNFYGQYGARISRKQSIHQPADSNKPHSYIIKFVSPSLFCAPDVHLKAMEDLWVDELTVKWRWEAFFKNLNEEWRGHIVYASILLNANVAFLAIPGNDIGILKIASYLSVANSIGSFMIGLLLARQHRTKEREPVAQISSFLGKQNLEFLAIMYSLPYALLMWGMVTFLAAFMFMCFLDTTWVTRGVMGGIMLLITLFVAWCIMISWSDSEDRWWSLVTRGRKHLVEGIIHFRSTLRSKILSAVGFTNCDTQFPGEPRQSASLTNGIPLRDIESNLTG